MKQKIYLLGLLYFLFMSLQAYSQLFIVCKGTTKTYSVDTVDGPTGTPGSTYNWTLTGPSNSAVITGNGTNSVTIQWINCPVGNYTLSVTETNSSYTSPCGINPVSISISMKENPFIRASSIGFCPGETKQLTATKDSGVDGGTYTWTVPGGVTNPGNVNSFAVGTAGTYTVKYTDDTSCESNTVTVTATQNTLPSAAISTPSGSSSSAAFCTGSSINLTTTPGLSSYEWMRDGNLIAGATTYLYSANTPGLYTVTVKDANNCVNTTSPGTTLTVNPLPNAVTISADGFTEFCQGNSVNLTSSDTSVSNTYEWTNDSNTVVGTSSTFNATATGIYKVKVSDGNGCSVVSPTQPVQVRLNPSSIFVSFSGSLNLCGGTKLISTTDKGSNYKYEWIKNGTDVVGINSRFYDADSSGTYNVRVIDNNYSTACSTTSTNGPTIVINPLPITTTITY